MVLNEDASLQMDSKPKMIISEVQHVSLTLLIIHS
jgi:hypothetical protein